MHKTKIVATLGPATGTPEIIEQLIWAGVNVFRLNFSHGDHAMHDRLTRKIRQAAIGLGQAVAILQDISGPKIRVEPTEPIELASGGFLQIAKAAKIHAKSGKWITINHPEILDSLLPGEEVYFADGAIRTEVKKNDADKVTLRVLVGGRLTSRKGMNLPVSRLEISAMTAKDREDIRFGVSRDLDILALSFVRTAQDILDAKLLIAEEGGDCPVFAKIEKAEALENLDKIIEAADGIMIARGDLGVELGIHRVPIIQKRIITRAREKGIPVIIATQMLTSMISSPYPTRAEVSDIANSVLDGADAVMLSDETTVGEYPLEAVRVLNDVITETETDYPWHKDFKETRGTRRAMAAAAVTLAERTGVKIIVTFTETGLSALMVARQRPNTRIIACTSNPKTYRRLAVIWGVEPFLTAHSYPNSDEAIYHFAKAATARDILPTDQPFIVTIGRYSNKTGSTNVVQLVDRQTIAELEPSCK